MINELYIKNIRCFKDLSKIKLSRFTVLVGENSTGKSTFLGAYNALSHLLYEEVHSPGYNPFNKLPFNFGNFQNIAHGREKEFLLGGSVENGKEKFDIEYTFNIKDPDDKSFTRSDDTERKPNYTEKKSKVTFNTAQGMRSLEIKKEKDKWILSDDHNHQFTFNASTISYTEISTWISRSVVTNNLPYSGDNEILKRYKSNVSNKEKKDFNAIISLLRSIPFLEEEVKIQALGPPPAKFMRREDKIDPFKDEQHALESIQKIGEELKLFSGIRINKVKDYYQLLVKTFGNDFHNIKDVGYGVSSILPLLRRFTNPNNENATFLLQQPEIHLHPMAQAGLVQFLAEKSKSHFLIETHSDYILNRLCICILKKVIKPEDVKVLYFEAIPKENRSKIHEINMNENGELINPPESYRNFFLKETDDFLGI